MYSLLGLEAARRVVTSGRASFFGSADVDLPVRTLPILASDDLVPQFGFVGANFESARVVLVGINPGNGPDNYRHKHDALMMPLLERFVENSTEENFALACQSVRASCEQWPLWRRHCSEVIGAGKLTLDDIAYVNCLPWRTDSKSAFSDSVAEKSIEIYLQPLFRELAPRVTIALGKRAAAILRLKDFALGKCIVWNRAQALTQNVKADRIRAAKEIFAAVGMES